MKKILFLFIVAVLLVGCGNNNAGGSGEEKPLVVTTTGQIADAVRIIAGDSVEVKSLMGPGVDPHLYKATQGDLQVLEDADIIFYNGLALEGKMSDIFEKMQKAKSVVAIGEVVPKDRILNDEAHPELFDPHIWFDIEVWKLATHEITKSLTEEFSTDGDQFAENERKFFEELDELNGWTKERISEIPEEQRVLVTAHDAFNYFGESNGMEVRGLQGLSTDAEYGLKDIQNIVNFLVEQNIKAVFIESSVSDKAMNAVIEGAKEKGHTIQIGGELYSDAMGAEGTEEGTYIGMYKHNVNTIVDSLK
ncbi:zinc ABC transporter substrate-binding protein [Psychrobacillus sp. Sa2BUA9]|uniref:Zinc ABC transporter substrate-binding protein n=1 Tax=Psychrobacillus faecigallinarum TaxID=2762235 RepID=A0ABR8RAY5_9BACI|nr:zinc ABC transporter substrate-binding protein [Psychrobacillus faecigallinarum]MBD7944949.1 zinc ABC transporter substrate-binding protein [Psychrobacillus faecigallinarum]